jgi:hypothetical protein
MRVQSLGATLLLSCALFGCIHNDALTMGGTRKIASAETPWAAKGLYLPTFIVEFVVSPITGYIDAFRIPATNENGEVYFSFIATRTLARVDMNIWHHFASVPGPLLMDLLLFPFSGLVDGIRILAADN